MKWVLTVLVIIGLGGCARSVPDIEPKAGPLDCRAPTDIDLDTFISQDELWKWNVRMASYNFRHTGSAIHRQYIDWLEEKLLGFGLKVTRYPVPINYWEPSEWSLAVTDANGETRQIPVAFYWPYSGNTPSSGITADVVDVGKSSTLPVPLANVQRKIVLVDRVTYPLPGAAALAFTTYYHRGPDDPIGGYGFVTEDFTRLWLGIPAPPSIESYKQAGALGVIDVLDLHPDDARGQFTPHQQPYADIPAIHIDRVQGKILRELLAQGAVSATLKLVALREPRTVDYLVAELPGSHAVDGAIMINTHTDGQNALEENGGMALLAMADYFSRFKVECRQRDMLFVFSAIHMIAGTDGEFISDWLAEHPEITGRIKYALTAEHLGSMAWKDDAAAGTYEPTGKTELSGIAVGNSVVLNAIVLEQMIADDMGRTSLMHPDQNYSLYGEGTGPFRVGIPTAAFISGPTYLLSVNSLNGHLDKLDPSLLFKQTLFLTHILGRIDALPANIP